MAIQEHRRLLGEAVRAKRKRAGFSQEKLAEKADLSTVFISRIGRVKAFRQRIFRNVQGTA